MKHLLTRKKDEFSAITGLLQSLSPLNTLERGYAIIQNKEQQIITHTTDTSLQDQITVTLTDGMLDCDVQRIRPTSYNESDTDSNSHSNSNSDTNKK